MQPSSTGHRRFLFRLPSGPNLPPAPPYMITSTLRLFKSLPIESRQQRPVCEETLRSTVPFGYVLDPEIQADENVLNTINDLVGISGEQANATFHKSWEKVRTADIEQLVLEQIMHYFTTYGFRSLGINDPSSIYIPNEKLELPEITDDISLTYIRSMTRDELLDAIVRLGSGIALHEKSLYDIMAIVQEMGFEPDLIERVGNYELMARLCGHFNVVPRKPVDFLRYVVFLVTGSSLLIKNDNLIALIKEGKADQQARLDRCLEQAPEDLASIFYRYKPIFLALKSLSKNKTFFNRLRKQAVKQHRPLPVDYLNSVTSQIRRGTIDFCELERRIEKATVFRKIRLAYALQYRLNAGKSIVYLVRNGRGWATDFDWPEKLHDNTLRAFRIVRESLIENLRPQVDGKIIYIPDTMSYALPATEKQFAGPFPFGSYVTNERDTVFGIQWFNVGGRRIDLDLSLMSAEGKIGWDAAYRGKNALFSGDITDAPRPNGATELFYVKQGTYPQLVLCNYFNFSASKPVDAKILVACDTPKKLKQNHMIDVNKVVAKADITVDKLQTVLGMVLTVDGQTRFYFGNVSVGCTISSADTGQLKHAREFLTDKFASLMDFGSMLAEAGAKIVNSRPADGEFVDLSPENLIKSSVLSLIQGK